MPVPVHVHASVLNTYIVWQGSNLFSDNNFRSVKRSAAHATKQEKLYVAVDCRYLFAGAATTICCPAELPETPEPRNFAAWPLSGLTRAARKGRGEGGREG